MPNPLPNDFSSLTSAIFSMVLNTMLLCHVCLHRRMLAAIDIECPWAWSRPSCPRLQCFIVNADTRPEGMSTVAFSRILPKTLVPKALGAQRGVFFDVRLQS